jgi:hypothetical protein
VLGPVGIGALTSHIALHGKALRGGGGGGVHKDRTGDGQYMW